MPFVGASFNFEPPFSPPEMSGPTYANASIASLFLRSSSEALDQSSSSTAKVRNDYADPIPASIFLKSTIEPRSPRRPNICGFSPLPSIIASPICTPTSSLSSQSRSGAFSCSTLQEDSDSATNATSYSSLRVLLTPSTPTWIATPPTPPSKVIRRSNTTSPRRTTLKPLSPSASFPASMHPHGKRSMNKCLKRSSSVPTFSTHPGLLDRPQFSQNFMREDIVQSPDALSIENTFDAFSDLDGIGGPDDKTVDSGPFTSIFRLSTNSILNAEDESTICIKNGPGFSSDEPSPDGSWSDHSAEDIWETERHKDALRKFHALKELLATETRYLMDLKALVTVYLRNLPTLAARPLATSSTFGRASSSFTSGPWIHSYTQLQAAALSSSATLPDTQNIPSSVSANVKEANKNNSHYLFSDTELESLTRNAEEILQLHEHFVRELRAIMGPLGFPVELLEEEKTDLGRLAKLDDAIRAVSTKFATEASRFNAYQTFCAGHPEAMDIIRKTLQQFPLELDAFEQRCAEMAIEVMGSGSKPAASEPKRSSSGDSESPTHPPQNLAIEDRKRTHSYSSLDGGVRTLRPRSSLPMAKDSVVFPSETRRERSPRIAFTDYMIKPIQRICKYPLLLDQLLPCKALRTLSQNVDARSDVDVIVESAAQAMRHVATSVDEARRRQEIAIQSALIFSRIFAGSASASTPSVVQALSSEFFASLGNCLLSGSLDLMHYHPNRPLGQTSSIKAKYFGAFLYSGGYLILVKVSKGRKYEPKHWFSLVDFEVSGVEDDGSLLPCSFRLSSGEMHFELAAACQSEKDAWLSSIHESLTHVPSWVSEPIPSFRFDEKGELLPESDDGLSETPVGLATIRSIPELAHNSDAEMSEPFFASLRGHGKSKKRRSGHDTPTKQDPPPPSRRSSSTSVKAIFSPMASTHETVLIRRSSPTARLQVDQELQDVISHSVLTARSYAFSHEVELFQAPKTTRSGFSRSNSGIGMAGMARLSKHESVRVPRRRTTESLDGLLNRGTSPLNKSTSSGKRNLKKLSLASIEFEMPSDPSPDSANSPCPSPPSFQSTSGTPSLLAPEAHTSAFPSPPVLVNEEQLPVKTRSFVRNVRGIFHLRPASPVPVSSHVGQPSALQSAPLSGQSVTHYNVLHRWTVRRRARSVNDRPRSPAIFEDPEKSYSITPSRTDTPLST